MPRYFQAVIDAKVGPTKYLFSNIVKFSVFFVPIKYTDIFVETIEENISYFTFELIGFFL